MVGGGSGSDEGLQDESPRHHSVDLERSGGGGGKYVTFGRNLDFDPDWYFSHRKCKCGLACFLTRRDLTEMNKCSQLTFVVGVDRSEKTPDHAQSSKSALGGVGGCA